MTPNPCGCYYGEDCTRTTVCAVHAAVEDVEEANEQEWHGSASKAP